MRRTLLAAACAALAATATISAAPTASAASVSPPAQFVRDLQYRPTTLSTVAALPGGAACPSVIAYVSRGSDENPGTASEDYGTLPPQTGDTTSGRSKYYGGVGEEMSPLVNHLGQLYGSGFRVVANTAPNYPAVGVDIEAAFNGVLPQLFMDSIYTGAQNVVTDLNAITAKCPSAKLAVIGYSQGAIVNRLALGSQAVPVNGKSLAFTPAAGRAVSLTFGDPTWNRAPGLFNARFVGDTYSPGTQPASDEEGLASWVYGHNFPVPRRDLLRPAVSPASWNFTTFCHGQDAVCQAAHQMPQAAAGQPHHITYDERDFFAAAGRAAAVFATGTAPVRTLIPSPSVDLAPADRCLARNATLPRTAIVIGPPGSTATRTFQQSWRPSLPITDGTVTPASRTVTANTTGALSAKSSANLLYNDVLQITAQTPFAGAPVLPVYSARLCPAL